MSTSTNPYVPPQVDSPDRLKDPCESPTYARFGVIGFTIAMSFLLYLDRFALAASAQTVTRDLKIDEIGFGWVTSAFFWTYALCQVPAGWICDRFGGRITLTICVAGWSLALMGSALVEGLVGLVFFRALLGIFQAPAYPAAGGYLKEWMPMSARGFANGSTAMSGRSGGVFANVVTPLLMGLLATSFALSQTWRHAFAIYGGLGLIWCIAFWLWFRDRPSEHAGCNDAERDLISSGRSEGKGTSAPALPIVALLTSRNVWLISGVNFFSNIGWIFFATWMPKYLQTEHRMSEELAGVLTGLTAGAGMLGCLIGGFVSDIVVHRLGIYWGRRATPMIGMGLAVILYGIGSQMTDVYILIGIFTAVSFLVDFELSSRWSACQDIGGKYTATVLGFGNMCGNLAAAIFPTVIGYLAKEKYWGAVFMISCAAFFCTWLCWVFFDSRVPIVPEEGEMEKPKAIA